MNWPWQRDPVEVSDLIERANREWEQREALVTDKLEVERVRERLDATRSFTVSTEAGLQGEVDRLEALLVRERNLTERAEQERDAAREKAREYYQDVCALVTDYLWDKRWAGDIEECPWLAPHIPVSEDNTPNLVNEGERSAP